MKVALIGYGKMGKAIEEVALQNGHDIVLKIHIDNTEEFSKEKVQQADVAIEFSGPDSAVRNIKKCFDARVPVVCGSTGWLENLTEVEEYCNALHGSFLYASNFSIGVNLFLQLNTFLAQLMNKRREYDVSLEEIHHTEKKDAPSGTAITLGEQILEQVKRKKHWVNNESDHMEELAIVSKRIDPAPGTHKVLYRSDIDEIEIVHTAHSRKGFASGAVMAAEFLKGKKGIYSMKDVLGI